MKKQEGKTSILVVDDSPETIELIARNLESLGYEIYSASNVQSALKLLLTIKVNLVISDLKMPGESGIELVRHVNENYKGVGTLVITGFPSIQGAIESIKVGAEEYLVKPFTDEELFKAVERALARSSKHKRESGGNTPLDFGIIGNSEGMQKVYKTISKAMNTNATVLINGESGTGKELVARALHYGSNASAAP
ncbi:MAG TPA: response regulator, partial [Cyclobacteriaceae bacterium]|nr:response regulator [Cyclobacteriaceae bacterium]